MESPDVRFLESLPAELVTTCLSVIGLGLAVARAPSWMRRGGIATLIKPQLKAGPKRVGMEGVARRSVVYQSVLG